VRDGNKRDAIDRGTPTFGIEDAPNDSVWTWLNGMDSGQSSKETNNWKGFRPASRQLSRLGLSGRRWG